MTTTMPRTVGQSASDWDDDVLRRVVKAWTAGYGINHDAFALGIGMHPRTFARRLAGVGRKQAFSAGEVADMAAYMSRATGEKVSVADLYAGQVSVFPPSSLTGQLQDGEDASARPAPTNPCLSGTPPIIRTWRQSSLRPVRAA